MRRVSLSLGVLGSVIALCGLPVAGQRTSPRLPAIDVHVHSTNTSPQDALARMRALNIRFLFVSSLSADLPAWAEALNPSQFLPAVVLPCDQNRAPISGRTCWDGAGAVDVPDPAWLRAEVQAGHIKALGEMAPEYIGMSPNDERLEPYWQLAEDLDIPVGIHMGLGPPGAAYDSNPSPFKAPRFAIAAGDPLLLEPVLLRHKRLRLFVMHAGWPRLEPMLALLYAHPNVYVDVAVLQVTAMLPRSAYYHYLQALVQNGFGKRIMFGSDFPSQEAAGIDAIQAAEFLTPEQKADILCGNAARFFRLDAFVCAP